MPIPLRYGDVDDRFTVVIFEAPEFANLQRRVKYTVTLGAMIDSLRQGIEAIAGRSKSEAAQALYAQSLELLQEAARLFSEADDSRGGDCLRQAHNKFLLAGHKRPVWN